MMTDLREKYQALLQECDQLLKAGKIPEVASLISKINFAQVPRASRPSLAKLCRRAGLIVQGLRLLHPVIRNEKENEASPSASETSEYAVLLSRNGSVEEALNLLRKVDVNAAPEALLYEGFCHILNWDYAKSAKVLESFLTYKSEPYTQLIAKVNLVASYVAISEIQKAETLLAEVLEHATATGAHRLVGNCLELKSHLYFDREDFGSARKALQEAGTFLHRSGSYDELMLHKWNSIMEAIETKKLEPLLQFREKAVASQHWQSVRDADLFASKVHFDQRKFDHLMIGTPMPAYRERILNRVPAKASSHYVLGSNERLWLDLESGEMHGVSASAMNAGKKIHQALSALTRDLYVPVNLGTLFAELYPDEYFDINSSPLRIRQWVRRTREWLKKNNIAATISFSSGAYSLTLQPGFGIKLPLERARIETHHLKVKELEEHFTQATSFSAEQACEVLNISRSSFHRLVKWGVSSGQIEKVGNGRATSHRLTKKSA